MAKPDKPMRSNHRRQTSVGLLQENEGVQAGREETLQEVEEQKAEESLQGGEKYFRTLIENSSDAVVVLNDDGTVRYEGPSFERLLGYRPGDRVGKNPFEVVHPDDLAHAAESFEQLLKNPGSTMRTEVRGKHQDGSWRILEIAGRNLLADPSVGGIVANFRDITEHRRMEEALRESELLATATIEQMSDGVMLVGMDGKVAYVNEAFEKMLGYRVEELIGTSAVELPTYRGSKDRKKARQALKLVIEKGGAAPIDMIALTKSGEEIPISFTASVIKDTKGNPKTLVAVLRDVTERKQAEEALRRSEEYFKALTENASDGVLVLNGDGTLHYESPSMERMLGRKPGEQVGKNLFEFAHPDDVSRIAEAFAKLAQNPGSILHTEIRILHKDGSWRIFEGVCKNLLDNPFVEGLVINARDITERRKAEEALQNSEKHFRSLVENALDVITVIDGEGIIRYETPSIENVLGYKLEERIGSDIVDFVHPDDMPNIIDAFDRLAQNPDTTVGADVRARHRDGSWRIIEARAKNYEAGSAAGGFVLNWRDITERKQAEEDLRRNEEYFRTLMDNSLDAVTIINENGTIRYESPSYERLLGFKPEERVGSNLFERIHPDDMAKVAELFAEFLKNRGGTIHTEVRAQHKDSSWRVIEATGSNLLDNPVVRGIVVNLRDISERKVMEGELRESEERFRAIFDNAVDGIVLADLDNKKFYTCNRMFSQMLGYSVEEIKKLGVMDIHPEKDLPYVVKQFEKQAAREIVLANDIPVKRKDGSIFYADVNSSLITLSGKSFMVGIFRDVTERKEAAEALRRSEEKLRLYLESSPDCIYISDARGVFLYGNRAAERLTGYLREELLGKSFLELSILPQGYLLKAAQLLEFNLAGEPTGPDEFELIRKDGSSVSVEISTRPIGQGDGIEVIGIARDITERKRMEEEVRRLSDAVKMTTDSVAITDMSGMILDINEAGLRMYGLSDRADFVGTNPLDAIAPEDQREAIKNMAKIMQTGQVRGIEYHVVRKDGSRVLIETSVSLIKDYEGKPKGLVAVARDITERRRMEEERREAQEKYRQLIDTSIDAVISVDSQMSVILWNKGAERMFGYKAEEMLGQDLMKIVPERYRKAKEMGFGRFAKDGTGLLVGKSVEISAIKKDGTEFPVELSLSARDIGGAYTATGIIRDITERKMAEKERKRLEGQIQLAGRLAAVGELSAGVAHELNNPLAAIQGYAQLLTSRNDLDEITKKDVETIYREAQRASKITQNLLSFARRHEPEKRYISLNDALEKTLELQAHQMKVNNIELVVEMDGNLPRTMADFHQMQQVFLNIIVNAEQAMVEAHGKGKLLVRTQNADGMIQITFTDDGPGITEENLKRIFDPFFTTKEVGKGTGLGLSICYGLVQAHGGRLYARSKLGEGTTFVAEIPIVSEENQG